MKTKVRFAPSPTGYLHIGGLRTALYTYLFAKKEKGNFILRIEDTDQKRFVEGAIESLVNSLKWANVQPDEGVMLDENQKIIQKGENGPYIQSQRLEIYKKYIDILLEKGYAYYCFCTKERLDEVRHNQMEKGQDPMYDGHCKNLSKEEIEENLKNKVPYVIRLNVPKDKDITFDDMVRGKVTINSNTVDDQVLIKSDGFPTYHFAVVVDDHLMEVTHVIRGEEWLTSTPKHIILYDMFGWEKPKFAHLSNILNEDKKKLSKRQGDVSVEDFKNKGYLPEALVNYIALVGWAPKSNDEIFSLEELVNEFSFDGVSISGGVFDKKKLNWVNSHYIKESDNERLVEIAIPFILEEKVMTKEEISQKRQWLDLAMETVKDRLNYLKEFPNEIKAFLEDKINEEEIDEEVKEFLKLDHMKLLYEIVKKQVESLDVIKEEDVQNIFKELKANKIKGKNLFMGIRTLTTGIMHGPDIDKVIVLLGKDRVLKRIEQMKEYVFS